MIFCIILDEFKRASFRFGNKVVTIGVVQGTAVLTLSRVLNVTLGSCENFGQHLEPSCTFRVWILAALVSPFLYIL